jgi:hypothetical protein
MSKPYWFGGVVALVLAAAAYFWFADPSFDDRWDITGLATVLLAATTAYLAFTTRGEARATTAGSKATADQAEATREQVEITAAQLERSHRPVLTPTAVGPRIMLSGAIEVDFENVGMGPALSVHVEIAVDGWPEPRTDFIPALAQPMTGVAEVEPPATGPVGQVGERQPVVLQEGDPIYLDARLTYQDVAGKTYWTQFSWVGAHYEGLKIHEGSPPGEPGGGAAGTS